MDTPSTKASNKVFEQINRASTRGFLAFLALIIFIFIVSAVSPHSNDSFNTRGFKTITESIKVTFEDGTAINIKAPADIKVPKDQGIKVSMRLPQALFAEDVLYIYSNNQDMQVFIDGRMRGAYHGNDRINIVRTPAAWFKIELNQADKGRELLINISNKSSAYKIGVISPVYAGDKTAILYHIFWTESLWGFLGFFIFTIGCILAFFFLMYKTDIFVRKYIYIGFTLIFTGSWVFFANQGRQLFLNQIAISQYIGFLSANLAIYPFIKFLSTYHSGKEEKVFKLLAIIDLLNLLTVAVLVFARVISPETTFRIVEVWAIVLGVIMALDMLNEYKNMRKNRSKEESGDDTDHKARIQRNMTIYIFKFGQLALLLGGAIDIVLLVINRALEYRIPFVAGTMIFSLCSLISFMKEIRRIRLENLSLYRANEEKSRFLAKMSHAIRTPVNSVLGMNKLILRESNDPVIHEYAEDIERAGNSLISTIDDILDASTVNSNSLKLNPVKYEISSLVNDCRSMMYLRAENKHLKFIINMNPEIPMGLIGDEYRLREIILNLLSNAIKYTRKGSVIFICTYEKINDNNIKLIVSVKDTGIGIKSENIGSIFSNYERFSNFQNRNIEGTGLGLVITKNLIDKMGGTITVNSVYGSGTEFTVTIPQEVYDSRPAGPIRSVEKKKTTVTREDKWFRAPKAHVLVVDDVIMNRKVIMKLMAPSQMQIDSAENGAKALEMASVVKYDLIYLDHMMPEMDGIETLKKLRESSCPDTPVVMLTANAIPGIKEMYLEAGFNDYLAKPVTEDSLIQTGLNFIPHDLIEKWPEVEIKKGEA